MHPFSSIIIGLVIGAVIGFFAYCVIQSKTKNKKKIIIAFAIGAIIVAILVCIIKVFVIGNVNFTSTLKETDSQYVTLNDIEIQTNQKSNTYYKVNSYEDFLFEYEDDNGETVDWTDEEKQELWDTYMHEEPYRTKILQAYFTSDYIALYSFPLSESNYDNIGNLANDMINNGDVPATSREDFNICGMHVCALYSEKPEEYSDSSMIMFIYKDNIYFFIVESVLTDIKILTEEMIEGIRLN